MSDGIWHWVVIPLLICCARIVDVSIGTIRIMLIARGRKILPPLLGFVEVLIWLAAIRQILNNLDNVATYIGFAAGFALGNYIGMFIEEKLAMGSVVIRLITPKDSSELQLQLKKSGYGVTCIDAQGGTGQVSIIFTIVNRRDYPRVIDIINRFHPKAFYSVEDVRCVSEGVFPLGAGRSALAHASTRSEP